MRTEKEKNSREDQLAKKVDSFCSARKKSRLEKSIKVTNLRGNHGVNFYPVQYFMSAHLSKRLDFLSTIVVTYRIIAVVSFSH